MKAFFRSIALLVILVTGSCYYDNEENLYPVLAEVHMKRPLTGV